MSQFANSQELLWSIVGNTFWTGYAIISGMAAVLWFRFIALSPGRDALTIARLLIMGGCVLGIFIRFNSAFEALSPALMTTGVAFTGVLANSRWCERRGTFGQKVKAIIRDTIWPTLCKRVK